MGLRDEIIEVLHGDPPRWTPAAVSWSVGRNAHGTLGQDPDPQVAVELAALVAEGRVAELPACPVCGRPGTLVVLASDDYDGVKLRTTVSGVRMFTPMLVVMVAIGTTRNSRNTSVSGATCR